MPKTVQIYVRIKTGTMLWFTTIMGSLWCKIISLNIAQKLAQNLTYVLHICSWSLPFSHLPSMCPAPGFLAEKLDSMLEAGDVIKQSGKEFLSALSRDSNMFTVCWYNKMLCKVKGDSSYVWSPRGIMTDEDGANKNAESHSWWRNGP